MASSGGSKLMKLSNGAEIPVVGLGTSKCDDVYTAICDAIDSGYRHIDTAYLYHNEDEIGRAINDKIRQGVVTRDQLWITSKVWMAYHRKDLVEECFNKTAQDLGVDYLDLYLIHWPIAFKTGLQGLPEEVPETSDIDYVECWNAMEELYKQGKVRNLGLSNFNSEQITRILDNGTIRPVINQVECHPYFNQEKLRGFCAQRGITLTAYSPLGSPGRKSLTADSPRIMDDPIIKQLATKHNKNAAQIAIRFQVQRGVVVIPKSANPQRIKENLQVFDFQLDDEDMAKLISINRDYRFITSANLKEHKYYPFNIEF